MNNILAVLFTILKCDGLKYSSLFAVVVVVVEHVMSYFLNGILQVKIF